MKPSGGKSAGSAADLPQGYREGRRLGDGAEGGAWTAIEVGSGLPVVLKRVPPEGRTEVRRAFETLRVTGSPHLPAPRALVEGPDGATWLVTDWVAGTPLGPGPIDLARALREAEGVARALAALHEAGTHHGDVAPANIVVTEDADVALVDLGALGRVGAGTPGFIAPEALAGGGGAPADLFSLGCVLCWRAFGDAPWPRPEALVQVRGADDVRRRLEALQPELPPRLAELLIRMLDPSPKRRPTSSRDVAERLAELRGPSAAVDSTPWRRPSRLAYRGVEVGPVVEALAAGGVRLVVIVGSAGSGRGRVVEEIVQALQVRGRAARLCESTRLAATLGVSAVSWLDAWIAAGEGDPVLGLIDAPAPPDAVREDPIAFAALLRGAAEFSSTPLVLPADPALGAVLEGPTVRRLEVHPWSEEDVWGALSAFTTPSQGWVHAIMRVTGGWPAATTAALHACARVRVQQPSPATIEAALAASGGDVSDGLDPALARAVLRSRWTPSAVELASLPGHLHDGAQVLGTAVTRARRGLPADTVRDLARRCLTEVGREAASLSLALDADDHTAIVEVIDRDGAPLATDPSADGLLAWVRIHPDAPASLLAAAAEVLLARNEPRQVLTLLEGRADALCRLQAARALQRIGRVDEALTVLSDPPHTDDPEDLGARIRGLRWRLLVDRGEAARAHAEAAAAEPSGAEGVGEATALLWSGYAALVCGETDAAERRLTAAAGAVAGRTGRDAAAACGRIEQLRGNLAQLGGRLIDAATHFDAAARAFEGAGEPVGALTLRGSAAALAVPMAAVAAGLEHGRVALRGLLASGQVAALPETVVNLVQLLMRAGATEEAMRNVEIVARLLSEVGALPPLAAARLARARADIEAGRLARLPAAASAPRLADQRQQAETAYVAAARALSSLDVPRETSDAWLRAAALARISGRLAACRSHLASARAAASATDDALAHAAAEIETVALETSAGDLARLERALAVIARRSELARARDDGLLELAWAHDRALHAAVRRCAPPNDPRRARMAARALSTLEQIMKKTSNLDAPAVRASFVAEGGDASVLEGLLEDLAGTATAGRTPSTPMTEDAASGDDAKRLGRLLRMYRRFAREDRLEPLLEQIVDAMMDLTDAERGAVVVAGTDAQRRVVTRELAPGTDGFKFSRSVIDRVLETGEPVVSVDAAADERFDDSRSISHLNLRSVLAVPLKFRGEVLGAAYVDHRLRRGQFGDDDLEQTEAFADLAALAVAHARALSEVRAQAERLQAQGAELRRLLEAREVEVVGLREAARTHPTHPDPSNHGIVGNSPKMKRVYKLIDRLADTDVPVVIHGESGTGKELVARAIHDGGSRRGKPFVAENCGAIPETLLESVLFGHAKGAFTGAQKSKPGLFEAAHGGTIFLDEVGEMSPGMQTKLLRVLQEGEVRRVGENHPRPVDVRVIAASNRDLDAMVAAGEFRQDLYYRINVVRLEIPPLRERVEDIAALVEHLASRHGAGRGMTIGASAMRALTAYAWPGNVRELENEVQRWLALSEGTVEADDLSPAVRGGAASPAPGGSPDTAVDGDDLRIKPRVDRLERDLIARALEQTGGNQTQSAKLLGLSRYGLQKKLRRLEDDGVTF